jgi:hypothetical protein
MSMYEVIGTNNPEYLLADPQGADIIAIPVEPGNGTIARGTVMYRKSTGLFAPAASGNATSSNFLVVLDESVNSSANMVIAEVARAFRAGRLIAGKVTLAAGADVTAAIALVLRQQGIVLDQATMTAAEFDNSEVVVTYKANGGTGNDVVAYVDRGSTYTIAANSFTAPQGKSFSKWNTKAAGTGTDYNASASYTANADLTLYAIWTVLE